jgi:hypothetical protein
MKQLSGLEQHQQYVETTDRSHEDIKQIYKLFIQLFMTAVHIDDETNYTNVLEVIRRIEILYANTRSHMSHLYPYSYIPVVTRDKDGVKKRYDSRMSKHALVDNLAQQVEQILYICEGYAVALETKIGMQCGKYTYVRNTAEKTNSAIAARIDEIAAKLDIVQSIFQHCKKPIYRDAIEILDIPTKLTEYLAKLKSTFAAYNGYDHLTPEEGAKLLQSEQSMLKKYVEHFEIETMADGKWSLITFGDIEEVTYTVDTSSRIFQYLITLTSKIRATVIIAEYIAPVDSPVVNYTSEFYQEAQELRLGMMNMIIDGKQVVVPCQNVRMLDYISDQIITEPSSALPHTKTSPN